MQVRTTIRYSVRLNPKAVIIIASTSAIIGYFLGFHWMMIQSRQQYLGETYSQENKKELTRQVLLNQ